MSYSRCKYDKDKICLPDCEKVNCIFLHEDMFFKKNERERMRPRKMKPNNFIKNK